MRITNRMMVDNLMLSLNRNLRSLDEWQKQLATGQRIRRPSDDPVGVVSALRYSTNIVEADQYINKIGEARDFLNTTDSALENLSDIIQRANELTIQGANGTNSESSLYAIAAEIRQLKEQVGVVANTTYGTKHIFAGTNVTNPPFDGVSWQGNEGAINLEIGLGVTIQINSNIGSLFFNEDTDNPGLFQLLDKIARDLESGNTQGLQQDISLVQGKLDEVNRERAVVGAKVNRLDLQQSRLESTKSNYTEILSQVQDADLAQVIMELKTQENVYRASLAAGSRIIVPSLADFLR